MVFYRHLSRKQSGIHPCWSKIKYLNTYVSFVFNYNVVQCVCKSKMIQEKKKQQHRSNQGNGLGTLGNLNSMAEY